MRKWECGMRSAECGSGNAECGRGKGNVEWGMRKVEWGSGTRRRSKLRNYSAASMRRVGQLKMNVESVCGGQASNARLPLKNCFAISGSICRLN
jgi:hypothetical protein